LVSIIVQKIEALGVSSNFLAKLYGCSNGQMAQYLNGSKFLPNHIGLEIYDLVVKLEHLANLADPLPLTFKNETLIRGLLKKIDEENLIIHVEDRSLSVNEGDNECL